MKQHRLCYGELLLNGCSDRAGFCTVTAADALIGVDNKDITFGNAGNRALGCASTACYAIFCNLVCHFDYLHSIVLSIFYHIYEKNQGGFGKK